MPLFSVICSKSPRKQLVRVLCIWSDRIHYLPYSSRHHGLKQMYKGYKEIKERNKVDFRVTEASSLSLNGSARTVLGEEFSPISTERLANTKLSAAIAPKAMYVRLSSSFNDPSVRSRGLRQVRSVLGLFVRTMLRRRLFQCKYGTFHSS